MVVPALVADSLSTYVASNLMARALYSPMVMLVLEARRV